MDDVERPLERSRLAVEGTAFGDAFGETFFADPGRADTGPDERQLPPGDWRYTDDTVMALGIHEMLDEAGAVDPDRLADIFARRYREEPWRGYGSNARRLLERVDGGEDWRRLSEESFGGEGSFGNGAAMRVAPVGAFFADDLERATEEAADSARVTHAHPEGIAGAIAVAVAAAVARRTRDSGREAARRNLVDAALELTPAGEVRDGIERAAELGAEASVREAARRLGSGQRVTAMDTVPFVIWAANRWLDDLEEALWGTAAGRGDRDTTCAMVGGIVSQRSGLDGLGDEWFERREALDWRSSSGGAE